MNTRKVEEYIVQWLIDYKNQNNINGYIIGVSGGIDSAVTSTLCAKTGLKTLCLDIPIKQNLSEHSRAKNHIKWLKEKFGISVYSNAMDLSNVFKEFEKIMPEEKIKFLKTHALANTRARLRMLTLYYFASLNNYVVVGTGNKVEDFGIGFYTKYGDGGVDISPIADLSKSEVYELAEHLEIGNKIIAAKPTDGLWDDNRTDEEQIGASYDEIEWAMQQKELGKKLKDFNGREKEVFEIFEKHHNNNLHKMKPIPICKIPSKLK
jgi:NAD+ synthase